VRRAEDREQELMGADTSVVSDALGAPKANFWNAMREAFRDEQLRHRLDHIHGMARDNSPQVPESLSSLR
jgi:hypothetical protein